MPVTRAPSADQTQIANEDAIRARRYRGKNHGSTRITGKELGKLRGGHEKDDYVE